MLIDSHSHLFLKEFSEDLPLVMERARAAGISHIFMPNIDSSTIGPMLSVCDAYGDLCYPMMGLHPTSVNESYEKELEMVYQQLSNSRRFVAVGEIGLDLYWDKSYLREQLIAFEKQIEWALEFHLPIVIHCRDAFNELVEALSPYQRSGLTGIFHSFTDTAEEATRLLEFSDFLIGINGVVTFKKSHLPDVLPVIPLNRLVLETDSPYLTPAPNRGKRNESANLKDTLIKVAEVYQLPIDKVAQFTSENALKLFRMFK